MNAITRRMEGRGISYVNCHDCGGNVFARSRDSVVECPVCGAAVDPTVAKNIRSVRSFLRLVHRDEDLPSRLREDLATRLETDLADLEAAASRVRMPEPEPPTPAPEPPPEPTPEPPIVTHELPPRLLGDPEPAPEPVPAPPPPRPTGPFVSRKKPAKPKREGPTVWERLGPAFTENILFALAAFLMVAGAVFFVTTAWTTMTGQEKLLVILGGLELLGFLLYGAGRLLNRGGTLPEVERVLLVVVAFLVPVAAAAAGEILRSSTALGLVAAAAVIVPGWFALRSVARRTEPALSPGLAAGMTAISLLTICAALSGGSAVTAGALLAVVVTGIAYFAARDVVPHVGENLNPVLWSALLIAFGTLVAAGTIALAAARDGAGVAHPLACVGIALSSVALFGALLEGALTGSEKLTKARALPFLVGSLALAVAGSAIAAGNESALLVASGFGAAAAIHAGSRLPSAWLLLPGLALSAVAYIYLPAPVRSAALALRDRVAAGLGYDAARLPLSWYAVSLVPYVAVSGAMGIWLRRRGAVRHGKVLAAWSLAVAVGLCLMSVVLGSDLRAPAAAFAAQGALLIVLSRFARSPGYVYVGTAGLFVSLAFLLGHLGVPEGIRGLAFGAAELLGLAISRRLGRLDPGDGFPARAGSAVFRVTLVSTLFVGAVLSGGVLVRWAGWLSGSAPILAGGWLPAAGYLLFLLLVLDIGRMAGTAIVLPAAALIVAGAVECLIEGTGMSVVGAWRPVFFTAVAGLHLLVPRPHVPGQGRSGGVAVTLAILAHSVFGIFPRIETYALVGFDGPGALSLLAIGVLLIVAGQWLRQTWSGALAAPVLLIAAMAIASALGYDPTDIAGAIAIAASALVLGALCFPLRAFVTPWRITIALVALVLTVWMFALAGPGRYGVPVAALLSALAARLAMAADRREPFRSIVGSAGSIALAWVTFGLLAAARAELHFAALGLVISAAVAMYWAGRNAAARAVAGGHLFVALLLASMGCAFGNGSAPWHCVTMLLVMVGGRILIDRFAHAGTSLVLLALAALASLGLGEGVFDLDPAWQPAILLGLASAALLLPRVRALALENGIAGLLAGVFALLGLWFVSHNRALSGEPWAWSGVVSVAAGAVLLIVTGCATRLRWAGGLAAPVVALAGYGTASALGHDPNSSAGAVGVSAAAVLLAGLSFPFRRFAAPWQAAIAITAVVVTGWLFPFAGPERYAVPIAAAFAALAARLAVAAGQDEPMRTLVGVAGSLVLAWVPTGLLLAAGAPAHFLGLGLVASAAVAAVWAGRHTALNACAGVHLVAALVLAGEGCLFRHGEPAIHAVTMLLVMVGGRLLAFRLRAFGTALILAGLAALASLAVGHGILELDPEWQPAILAAFASVALLAPRIGSLGLDRRVATGIAALPMTGLTAIAAFGAVGVAAAPAVPLVYHGVGRPALLAAAALFALGAWFLSRRATHPGRDAIWIVAVGLAVFAFAPVNQLIGGGFPRPDIEIALLAALVAARLPVRAGSDRPAYVAQAAVNGVYVVSAGALLLTAFEWHHLSTPLTLFALILPSVVLLRRSGAVSHATVAGFLLLGAALTTTMYAFPADHVPRADLFIAFSVACALTLLFLRRVGEWARTRGGGAVPEGTGRSLIPPAAAAHLFSLACLAANIVVARGPAASGLGVAAAVLSMGIGGVVSLRIATTRDRPWALHGTVVSLLLLYAFLAVRTGVLGVLDGYHLHALIVIGTGIFLAAPRVPEAFRGLLRADGLLLAVPAVGVAVNDLMGSATPPGSAATALFLAAAFAGVAAARLRKASLGALSVVLLNLAVFSLWRRHGVVDPAFYGVPPGLTLLLGAELSRKHLAKGGRLALFLTGAALLYGSIGIQVLSVERPAHALVLFGLGIATVGFGVLLRRNSLLAAGTAVVVLDVVAYLARHGFQRGFLGAALLLLAGLTVLGVGTLTAKRRKRTAVSET